VYAGILAESIKVDPARITAHYRKAIELLRPYRDVTLLPGALMGVASVVARRDPERALKLTAAAGGIRLRGGGEFQALYRERFERLRTSCSAALESGAERIWAEGTRLTAEEAIALAFDTATPRRSAPAGLSARELDVVRLVADGMTNKAIATELCLSVRTVESHVRNVLAKARLQNRTQLAAWARERI
jgi:non-specific serine/threonine protein kinase